MIKQKNNKITNKKRLCNKNILVSKTSKDIKEKYPIMNSENSSNYSNEKSPIIELHNNLVYNGEDIGDFLKEIKSNLSIFRGKDEIIWGEYIVAIGTDNKSAMHALMFDKFGTSTFRGLNITKSSRYYSAVENLETRYRDSNARRGLAVTLLKKYPLFSETVESESDIPFDYDQTHAGELASSATLVSNVDPELFMKKLRTFGILPNSSRKVTSTMVDVVYENKERVIDLNNQLVFYLGEQLEQLFNPVNEYSPEQTEYAYKQPECDAQNIKEDTELVKSITNELLQLQTRFTYDLVDFLQNFLIVLRVNVLNEEIDGLSTLKLNRLFPPTIDEVTRINCIFLDSLKAATPYGSLEVLKACNITIPYFYKAYTRHEAATKNFSKDVKLFLNNFKNSIPRKDEFTEMRLDTIIKGPQEKLMKIKLIIDRLWESTDDWGDKKEEAEKYYNNIIDVIVSFGSLEKPLHSYTTRVFTPSGKILTELAKGWPIELQYKWLKRRVVGVYDVIDSNDETKRKLLVIFSDYVVFLDIQNSEKYYSNPNRPTLSDILTNSLINEVPLTSKIPKMKVDKFSYIDNMFVSIVDSSMLRFDCIREADAFSFTCKLATKSVTETQVADLLTKAKILEKDTAFHLFKAEIDEMTLYSTAHEYASYETEKIKSKVAVFLNMEPSHSIVLEYSLYAGLFVKFSNEKRMDKVIINRVLYNGTTLEVKVRPENLISAILEQLRDMIPNCYSSIKSPISNSLCQLNGELLTELVKPSFNFMRVQAEEVKDDFENVKQDVENFEGKHEKKKSYGTITTFRSYASDLKDLSRDEEDNKVVHSNSPKKNTVQFKTEKFTTSPTKSIRPKTTKIAKNKSPVKAGKESPKKNGLAKMFRSIFKPHSNKTGKNSKTKQQLPEIKKSVQIRKKQEVKTQIPISSPSKRHFSERAKTPTSSPKKKDNVGNMVYGAQRESPRKNQYIENSNKPVPAVPDITKSDNTAVKGVNPENRVSSVIHNDNFKTDKTPTNGMSLEINQKEEEIQSDFIKEISKAVKQTSSISNGEKNKSSVQPEMNVISLYDRDLFGSFGYQDVQKSVPETKNQGNLIEETKREATSSKLKSSKTSNRLSQNIEQSLSAKDETKESTITNDTVEVQNAIKPEQQDAKLPIFPTFTQRKAKAINFDRSASFIELYKGMRLVLDDTDAKYNWKRLPSLVSLSTTTPINAAENSHVFSSLTQREKNRPEMIKEESIGELVDSANNGTVETGEKDFVISKADAISNDPLTTLKSPFKPRPNIMKDLEYAEHSDQEESVSDFKNIFTDPKPEITVPNFRVVKTSPSRIVQVGREPREVVSELPITSSKKPIFEPISSTSELLHPQGRLLEIKDSQTDLQSTLANDQKADNSDSSIITDRSSALGKRIPSDNTESSVEDDTKLTKGSNMNSSDILEALDFSSFTLGFDDSNFGAERSMSTVSAQISIPTNTTSQLRRPAKRAGPQVYHLPKSWNSSSVHVDQQPNALGSIEEDPIWVSPSKMTFTDFGNINGRQSQKLSNKTIKGNKPANSKINMAREDSSFGYLSEYLTQDDGNNLKFV